MPRATRTQPARRDTRPPWTVLRRVALPAFTAVLAVVAWRWGLDATWLLGYLVMSAVAFLAYAMDKSAAVAGRWRTSENTLHLLALGGGWPGALLAQQVLRHKTRKPEFIAVFWLTVALNLAALVAWRAGVLPIPP